MKKAISVLLILVMVMALAACGKNEDPQPANQATEAPAVTKEAEPTKAAETTPEPTKEVTPEVTPEPTKEVTPEVTPEPTEEPTPEPTEEPEPDPDFDEFQVDDELTGYYLCENGWSMNVEPEGSADIIFVFSENTDGSTFGSYHEFWTNYDSEANALVASQEIYHYVADEMIVDVLETENTFELVDDGVIYWVNEDMQFFKVSDDTSENPHYINYSDFYEGGGDYGDGFGAEFSLENQNVVDLVGTTFYGVYDQSAEDPMVGSFYPYYGDEMSMETMDEFNSAFLIFGVEQDQGQLCYLDDGINEDMTWALDEDEFGTVLVITGSYSGEEYRGRFYWDNSEARLYVMIRIGDRDLWLSNDTRIVSVAMTEEQAMEAIYNYINATNESMARMLETGEYGVGLGVFTEENYIRVWLRSYTGAYKYYYIDPIGGGTYVTEFAPIFEDATEQMTDETLNAWDYVEK